MADRPLDGVTPRYPNFATADVVDPVSLEANVQTPSVEVQASGWRRLERPPRYWLNWLHRLYNQWIQWFDQEIESFRTILNVTIPNQLSGLDGRIDTLESEMDTAQSDITGLDGRLDTLETTVNTTVDGRLDTLESGTSTYPFAVSYGDATMEFAGIGAANVSASGYYVLHQAYSGIGGDPQKVTLRIQGISGTANGSFARLETADGALPAAIRPETTRAFPIVVQNNGAIVPGYLYINTTGRVMVNVLDAGVFSTDFALTGTKGFWTDIVVEYIIT